MDVDGILERQGLSTQGLMTAAELHGAGIAGATLQRIQEAGALVRVHRGVYARAPLPPTPRHLVTPDGPAPDFVLRVRAVLLSLGGASAATHRTAVALRGWGMLVEPTHTIEVAVPHERGRATLKGVRVVRARTLDVEALALVPSSDPLRVVRALRTVVDCALTLPLVEAVAICDSALRSRAVTVEELTLTVGRLRGRAASARLLLVLRHCDPSSGSVLESVLRVRMTVHGLAGFVTQFEIRNTAGYVVMRVDFAFTAARLVVEADGARWHRDRGADRDRENLLASLGWRVLRFTWADVVHQPERVLADISAALAWQQAA